MNIKRAREEIKNTIEVYLLKDENGKYAIPSIWQRPVLLIGPSGVGEAQVMEQISRECRVGLVAYTITHHIRQSAVGLPFIEKKMFGGREYTATECTMSEVVTSIYNMIEETGPEEGILFIDEINRVPKTPAPTMLQSLQCKTFGNHRIPEGWIIAAAGNPPEYNKSVRESDVMTPDCTKRIDAEPDLGVWKKYAYKENIHPAIVSCLGIKGQNFCHTETTVDGRLFATPRGWENLSELILIYEKLEKGADRDVISQYIQHPRIAKGFANYLELYYKYQNRYQVDQILEEIIREDLCDKVARASFDERLSVTGLLLSKLADGFKGMLMENQVVELLMIQLKAFRQGLEPGEEPREEPRAEMRAGIRAKPGAEARMETRVEARTEKRPDEVLRHLTGSMEAEQVRKKKNGPLGRQEDCVNRGCMAVMEGLVKQAQFGTITGKDETWQWVEGEFMSRNDTCEELKEKLGLKLEHAFDFMEAAFGNGQEVVIFVAKLNTSQACVWFLGQYECERHYRYDKELLFGEQEQAIHKLVEQGIFPMTEL